MKLGYLTSSAPDAIYAWAKRLVDDLNRSPAGVTDLPTHADDTVAGAANVAVGEGYVTPDGIVRRRVA
jgi:hypothetical protein